MYSYTSYLPLSLDPRKVFKCPIRKDSMRVQRSSEPNLTPHHTLLFQRTLTTCFYSDKHPFTFGSHSYLCTFYSYIKVNISTLLHSQIHSQINPLFAYNITQLFRPNSRTYLSWLRRGIVFETCSPSQDSSQFLFRPTGPILNSLPVMSS